MTTLTSWVVAVFVVFALVAFVLAAATVGVPSETSVPVLILLVLIPFRSFKNRRAH